MAIAWHEGMETGGRLLDGKHKRLIARANALLAAVSAEADPRVVEAAMRAFGDYAVRHFSEDEDCAMRGGCPALEWNAAGRAELIAILAAFRKAYERAPEKSVAGAQLETDLRTWISRYLPGPEAASRPCVLTDR